GDLRVHHRGDLPNRVPAGVPERRPRLQLLAHVGPRVVDRETFTVDRDLHVEVHIGIAERVVVDVHVGFVDAVRPRRDLLPEALGRVVDHRVDTLLNHLSAVTLDHGAEALRRDLRGTDLRAEVADVVGGAVVGLECVEHIAAHDAAVDDLHDRPTHPFAPDVVGGHVVATGNGAAGVA